MDEGDGDFTLEVTDPAGHRALRLAEASLQLATRARSARILFLAFGCAGLVSGLLTIVDNPLYGVGLVTFSVWYIEHCGLRSGVRRRLIKQYQLDPAALEPSQVRLDRTGLQVETPSTRVWHSWRRFEDVRPYDGGLLVVGRNGRMIHDLPPSSFGDRDERDRVHRTIRLWLDEAKVADQPPQR